jgi:hypothetical protein
MLPVANKCLVIDFYVFNGVWTRMGVYRMVLFVARL